MKILLVEDNYLQGEWLERELKRIFRCQLLWIQTESEFRSRLEEIAALSPDIAVIDVMLTWAEPSPDIPKAPAGWDKHSAGLRCQALMATHEGMSNIPVIFYTILGEEDVRAKLPEFPTGVSHLSKDSNPEPLVQLIWERIGLTRG